MWLFGSLWIERTVLYRVAVCAHMEPPVAVRSAPQAMAEMSFLPIAPVPDCSTLFPSCQAPTRCQTRYMMIIPCLIVLPPCSVRALPMPMEMSARMLPIPSALPKVLAMPMPLATTRSAPPNPPACSPLPETFRAGSEHLWGLGGASFCLSRGCWTLKLEALADVRPHMDVWDDFPPTFTPSRTLSPRALAGPFISCPGMCTTGSCSSMGPEQPTQASCSSCVATHTSAAALCAPPLFLSPCRAWWPSPAVLRSPERVGAVTSAVNCACTLLLSPDMLVLVLMVLVPSAFAMLLRPVTQSHAGPHCPWPLRKLLQLCLVCGWLLPAAEGTGSADSHDGHGHAQLLRSMGLDAALAALTVVYGLATLRGRLIDGGQSSVGVTDASAHIVMLPSPGSHRGQPSARRGKRRGNSSADQGRQSVASAPGPSRLTCPTSVGAADASNPVEAADASTSVAAAGTPHSSCGPTSTSAGTSHFWCDPTSTSVGAAGQTDRRTGRSRAHAELSLRQREAGARLALVPRRQWTILALALCLCHRAVSRRAAAVIQRAWSRHVRRCKANHYAAVLLRCRLLLYPQCARFGARLHTLASRRSAALALLRSSPRPILRDVANDDRGAFVFRDVYGVVSDRHPAFAATGGVIPAYSPDGSIVPPLSPPPTSTIVLCPEVSGAWCYYDTALGTVEWHAPEGSTSLVPRSFRDSTPVAEHPPPCIPQQMGLNSLAYTGYFALFSDSDNEVTLLHQQTGVVRDAPWIALRTRDGRIFFANLVTRVTRWLPPHRWWEDFVSRPQAPTFSRARCPGVAQDPNSLPCDPRRPLPLAIARQRVEAGAPYMHESGAPQFPPDAGETQLTYPLEGNYVRWPRASTPDRSADAQDRFGLPASCPAWLTPAAADAADACEAALTDADYIAARIASGRGGGGCDPEATQHMDYMASGQSSHMSLDEYLDWRWASANGITPPTTFAADVVTMEEEKPRLPADHACQEEQRRRSRERLEQKKLYEEENRQFFEYQQELREEETEAAIESSYDLGRAHGPFQLRPVKMGDRRFHFFPRIAPLLMPRLTCHAVALRAAAMIQRAWFWHVQLCEVEERFVSDDHGNATVMHRISPRDTPLLASANRLEDGPRAWPPMLLSRTSNGFLETLANTAPEVLSVAGIRGYVEAFLLVPPPFRFLLREPVSPYDEVVVPPCSP